MCKDKKNGKNEKKRRKFSFFYLQRLWVVSENYCQSPMAKHHCVKPANLYSNSPNQAHWFPQYFLNLFVKNHSICVSLWLEYLESMARNAYWLVSFLVDQADVEYLRTDDLVDVGSFDWHCFSSRRSQLLNHPKEDFDWVHLVPVKKKLKENYKNFTI